MKIPVVTVGGIADGRTLAAALALGAQGVMMATPLRGHEGVRGARQHQAGNHQTPGERDTTLICKSIGLQGRAIKNKIVEEVLEIEKRGGGLEELIPLIRASASRRPGRPAMSISLP